MRVLRWMVLIAGMFGGVLGLGVSAHAAPIPVTAGIVDQAEAAPTVQKARWYFYRRSYYRPRYYRRHYYRPRYYRRYYYRPRYYRRHWWRRRWYY